MVYQKITEGDTEFCQISETSIIVKTKADLEKEKKNLEEQHTRATEQYNEQLTELNNKLAIFTE